jgi:hypothetical protein
MLNTPPTFSRVLLRDLDDVDDTAAKRAPSTGRVHRGRRARHVRAPIRRIPLAISVVKFDPTWEGDLVRFLFSDACLGSQI